MARPLPYLSNVRGNGAAPIGAEPMNDTIEQIIDMLEAMTPAQRDTWLRMVRMEGYPPHVIEACEQAVAIIDGK